jgi:PD-(D/E)XK nuclease superfamily
MSALAAEGFSWSFSALRNYETCPRRYYEYNVGKRVTEPETDAIKAGHALHSAFDARIKQGTKLPLGMGMHEGMLAKFVAAPGATYAEQKLGLTAEFKPTTFFGKGVWFRQVIDATKINGSVATVLDWKTGRPDDDDTQLRLSAAVLFAHDANVQSVRTAFAFVNYDVVERRDYVRGDLTEIWGDILPRVRQLVVARQRQDYPPKPGGLCRRYCAVLSCPFHGK